MSPNLLAWPEWKVQAEKRYVKGSYTARDAIKDLGHPKDFTPKDYKIDFAKGKVRRKKRSTRQANQKVAGETRKRWLQKSNEHLTPEELAVAEAYKRENKRRGYETDHEREVQETGPQLDKIDEDEKKGLISPEEAEAERNKLREQGIGDDMINLVPREGEENRSKAQDVKKKNKALQDMEKRNPSLRPGYASELLDWQKLFERDLRRSNSWQGRSDNETLESLRTNAQYIQQGYSAYQTLQKLQPVAIEAGKLLWGFTKGVGSLFFQPRVY